MCTIRKDHIFFYYTQTIYQLYMVIYMEKNVRIFHYKHSILNKYEGWEIFQIYEEDSVIDARLQT